jgi:CDP-2,3-bis-(O-geranylgeranyl)-sn-glycerol synthase
MDWGKILFDQLIVALWLMLPVYMANNFATLLGGGRPIDLGRQFIDGKRILGDHKTIRGFVLGTLGGLTVALLQVALAPAFSPYMALFVSGTAFMSPPALALVALPLGALAGDAAKSFFKRRLGVPDGARLPVADQLDFVLGAWVLGYLVAPAWFISCFTVPVLIIIILITFPLQLFHNTVAVALGKKTVRW